jgi:hypothetical protein
VLLPERDGTIGGGGGEQGAELRRSPDGFADGRGVGRPLRGGLGVRRVPDLQRAGGEGNREATRGVPGRVRRRGWQHQHGAGQRGRGGGVRSHHRPAGKAGQGRWRERKGNAREKAEEKRREEKRPHGGTKEGVLHRE